MHKKCFLICKYLLLAVFVTILLMLSAFFLPNCNECNYSPCSKPPIIEVNCGDSICQCEDCENLFTCCRGMYHDNGDGSFSCSLASSTTMFNTYLPAYTIVSYYDYGFRDIYLYGKDEKIYVYGLIPCSESGVIDFYPSGQLKKCLIGEDYDTGYGILETDETICFCEDGSLAHVQHERYYGCNISYFIGCESAE